MGQWSEPFRVEEAGRWDRSHVFNARRRQVFIRKIRHGREGTTLRGRKQASPGAGWAFLPAVKKFKIYLTRIGILQ